MCTRVHEGPRGPLARQTDGFTAGGSNSRRVRSFCFDSTVRDVPFPTAGLRALVCSASRTLQNSAELAAAVYSYGSHRRARSWGWTGASRTFLPFVFPIVCLVLGKIALTHHKIRKITGVAHGGCESSGPRRSSMETCWNQPWFSFPNWGFIQNSSFSTRRFLFRWT